MTLCSECGQPLPGPFGGTIAGVKGEDGYDYAIRGTCIPCLAAKGSPELRVGLLLEAWDRFTALRVPPKVDFPLFFTFEARKGGSASLLLLPFDLRAELKIEAKLSQIREAGKQPVVLALFTPGLEPLYLVKGYEPPTTAASGFQT